MNQPEIMYEDDSIVVAYKPYGWLSEDGTKDSLPLYLRGCIGGYIGAVHRLDRTTQGLMLYAKSPESASILAKAVAEHRIEKSYLAVTQGIPEEKSGVMSDLLFYDRGRNKSYVVQRERRGVKRAELSYDTLAVQDELALVKIRLYTGRTHQIRVQFASRKIPLAGDRRYGSKLRAENIALCASELKFRHPFTGKEMRFSYTPDDGYFKLFRLKSV